MPPVIRVFFDYASPWAYLGTERVEAVAARCGARVVYQPFLLGGLFRAIGTPMIPLETMPPPKAAYVRRELERFAARDRIPYLFSTRFPLRTVDALRLTLLVPEEARAPIVHAIMRATWAEDRDPADRAVLADCARAAGIDVALVDRIADAKRALVEATDEAIALGVPGAPTFQVGTELLWGQDRLLFVEKALVSAQESPVNPHFTVFRVPVHVQPLFWLICGLFFGFNRYGAADGSFHIPEPASMALWFPIVFTAVLFHELGHALLGRRFGATPFVVLTGMGGYTQLHGQRFTPGRSAMVSFAGPLVGLTIGGLVQAYLWLTPFASPPVVRNALDDIVFTNLVWAIFNLIPIVGLDGGNIMAALFDKGFGPRGIRAALVISIFISVAIITLIWCVTLVTRSPPPIWPTLIFGYFAMRNYRDWQALGRWSDKLRPQAGTARGARPAAEPPSDARIEQEIERGFRALEERNAGLVRTIGESLAPQVQSADHRFQVAHLVAWGRLLSGDVGGARRALQQLIPPGQLPDALLEGAIRLELGNAADAVTSLAEAILDRNDDFVATRLARAVVSSGRIDPILALLSKEDASKAVGARPFQIVSSELAYAGRHEAARQVGEALFARFHEGADAFNVACALGRLDRSGDALVWLEKAIEAGLPDKSVLDTDTDIAPVRELPEFQAIREKAGLA